MFSALFQLFRSFIFDIQTTTNKEVEIRISHLTVSSEIVYVRSGGGKSLGPGSKAQAEF